MHGCGSPLEKYSGFILDLDGVVYLDRRPVPGAVRFLERLRGEGKRILFLTNNSRYTRAEYRRKLEGMGVRAEEKEILTSASATAAFLRENYELEGKTAYYIGGEGLREELEGTPLRLVEGEEAERARFVVVGWDVNLTYGKLKTACLALHRGAEFIGTNPDATFPTPEGLWPGAGSIIAALEKAAGRQAVVVGKPNIYMMHYALHVLGAKADETLMVGDRLETDVLGGWRAGLDTCLVLTGVTGRDEAESFSPRPDYIVEDLLELT